ncbi:nucleoporins domain-containing protein [Ditylenchus destructor]|nr:nucleoporins domain-containing protein [Ditylenchus destructor]
MWLEARNLLESLNKFCCDPSNETVFAQFYDCLEKNLDRLKAPLGNRPKSNVKRAAISKIGEEVAISGERKIVIDETIRNEATSLSDLFEMDEHDALELVVVGEMQSRNFRDLSRPLCAIVCYYDAHRYFCLLLKSLLAFHANQLYVNSASEKIRVITMTLLSDKALYNGLLERFSKFSVPLEFARLNNPSVNALGGPNHQATLTLMINDIESSCYEIVCLFSLYCPLENQAEVLKRLFEYVRQFPRKPFNVPQLAVWTSVLLFINPMRLKQQCDGSVDVFNIFGSLLEEPWDDDCLKATIELCFGVAIKYARSSLGLGIPHTLNDQALIDKAIEQHAFEFIHAYVLVPNFGRFHFLVDVLDSIIKNFICYFREKLHEMYNLCEEQLYDLAEKAAHTKNLASAHANLHFKSLIELITTIYEPDTEQIQNYAEQFTDPKCEALRSFVLSGRSISAPQLSITYLAMLRSLCKSEASSGFIFNMFNALFGALRKYFDYFRAYSGTSLPVPQSIAMMNAAPMISEEELVGLVSWTQLATAIAKKNPDARRQIYEDRSWNCIENVTGLLTCSIPLVLKGNLYQFLAALSIDESAAVHVWNCIISEGICAQLPNGRLTGIQQDLEEQECAVKIYDCSYGYLSLMQELFRHKARPSVSQLGPHLQFIIKSIISQFSSRSYKDPQQMWNLVKLAMDCLYELLRMFYVTQMSVRSKSSEIQVLGQLLNDSPLSRNLIHIIMEGVDKSSERPLHDTKRDQASFSAIRLFHTAISHQSSLADAIRMVDSNLIISSLDSILFSPLPAKSDLNFLGLLLLYLSESENLLRHSFFVLKILREACSQRPSLQAHIVQSTFSCRKNLIEAFSRLTSVFTSDIQILPTDLNIVDVESTLLPRVRGEIVRLLIETCIDSLEADPKAPNMAFLLLGFNFNLHSMNKDDIDMTDTDNDGLRNIMEIASMITTLDDLFSIPFSGLHEPSLRLLLKLASFGAASSSLIIRHMRSQQDLVYRLCTCNIFRKMEIQQDFKTQYNGDCTSLILRKSIQAIVLELVALELSSLIRMGHVEKPRKFIEALLSSPCDTMNGTTAMNESFATSANIDQNNRAYLWALLDQSRVVTADVTAPVCLKFDTQRLDELLRYCIRKNSCNIEQFDVEYLSLLLNTEISSILNTEIGAIRGEVREILLFSIRHNARNLLEGACIHLLSGWLAVINVLSLVAPLPFLNPDQHQCFLVDALFILKEYCFCVDTSVELSGMLSDCIFRLVRAICSIFKATSPHKSQMRDFLYPIIHLLLQCLILPGYSKCVRFKMDIYGSILCIFDTLSKVPEHESRQPKLVVNSPSAKTRESSQLTDMMKSERTGKELWTKIFEPVTAQVVSTFSSDITFAPVSLKIVATACLSDIIREDIIRSQLVLQHFISSGSMRCIVDSLNRMTEDAGKNGHNEDVERNRKKLHIFSQFLKPILSNNVPIGDFR